MTIPKILVGTKQAIIFLPGHERFTTIKIEKNSCRKNAPYMLYQHSEKESEAMKPPRIILKEIL